MISRVALLAVSAILASTSGMAAQNAPSDAVVPPPSSEAAIPAWNAVIVRRAAALIASPAQWNRADSTSCSAKAKSFSIRCAIDVATEMVVGRNGAKSSSASARVSMPDCRMRRVESHDEGSCGLLFDEATVFSIARTKSITTGVWRNDAMPSEVWAGRMINSEDPVLVQARKLVDVIAPGKYRRARLAEFNDDTTITFATLQSYFAALEERVSKLSSKNVEASADDTEIELYAGGAGIIRTYNGWFAVSGFVASDSSVRFQVDTSKQIAPNALDREILKRADALLTSDAVWNRADNRKCPAGQTKLSIYCALEQATREVTGGFHHRRPALELVRVIVEDRTKGRDYNHRLMDYNNDSTTHLADVRSLFAEALAKVK